MKISSESNYAIRIVFYICHTQSHILSGKEIIRNCSIPEKLGLKILTKLSTSKILISTKGVHGGFKVGRKPIDISLYDVISIFDQIEISRCIEKSEECVHRDNNCIIYSEFKNIKNDLIQKFSSISFQNLLDKKK